ncbi:MAG: arginine--tRNA ligase [bacterium]
MIRQELIKILNKAGVKNPDLTTPPNSEMGDFTLACFDLAKEQKKNPVEVAKELAEKIKTGDLIEKVQTAGPYLNFYLNAQKIAELVLLEKDLLKLDLGKNKKVIVEFAHPNTHKAFHIGHLRTLITGETLSRILKEVGFEVIRANYQGDVGMQIAKCLWGLDQSKDEYEDVKDKDIKTKVEFLGKVYAVGAQAFEKDQAIQRQIVTINEKIYNQDLDIKEVYKTTRQWSLDYFDHIYQRLDASFDRFYFESEVFVRGKEIVQEYLEKDVFKIGDEGAIIFPGEKYDLHNRVFINQRGFPTYEAKDLALAELQFSEHNPEKIIHVVGREQLGYFQVVFKALESTLPASKDKEYHLIYGWVSLKGGKMSSRTGKVILGEWLMDEVEKKVAGIMKDSKLEDSDEVIKKVSVSAIKYAFLKIGVKNDIKFDLQESVSLSGDSGPYLLYIVARIRSILGKSEITEQKLIIPPEISLIEQQLLLKLSDFSKAVRESAVEYDPSKIAKYLFDLAQDFNSFYNQCPVLKAEEGLRVFRLQLIKMIEQVMNKGLDLLGIETVAKM